MSNERIRQKRILTQSSRNVDRVAGELTRVADRYVDALERNPDPTYVDTVDELLIAIESCTKLAVFIEHINKQI
jgi:hypothetical protein